MARRHSRLTGQGCGLWSDHIFSILSKNFHLKFIITKPYKIQQKHRTNEFQLWFFGHHLVLLLILSRWHDDHRIIILWWSSHHQKHCLFLSLTKHEWISKIFGSTQFQMSQVHPEIFQSVKIWEQEECCRVTLKWEIIPTCLPCSALIWPSICKMIQQ